MQTRLLTREQYLSCFIEPMRALPAAAPAPCGIAPYVESINLAEIGVVDLGSIHEVYGDGRQRTHHVLLETDRKDVFLVVIVGVAEQDVLGHYLLDLPAEYSGVGTLSS